LRPCSVSWPNWRRATTWPVILHLNDTYQIEERPPDIPGMAQIAEAVRLIGGWVEAVTGEDRTLVVHSGDFLSPSFMTNRLGFAGKQMVELLNHCGVDYATVGNHEFDVSSAELRQRFLEADFDLVNANLTPPRGFADVRPHAFRNVRFPLKG
jgi:2',3'-cyclic-nucleotide 2'-phosphodiesterase (5'-nucleotidase family)